MVADDVLELGEDLEELGVPYMRIPAYILQAVDDFGLKFDQRLNRDFVDLLESLSIDIFKVLCFEFLNQLRVRALHVGLSDGAVFVQSEVLLAQFFMQKLPKLLFGDHLFFDQSLQDQLFLFFPGGVGAKQDVHIEDVIESHTGGSFFVFRIAGSLKLIFNMFIEEFMRFD